jgi:uroporphyrinogen-III decarboxylase
MTPRELVTRTLNHETTPRVPRQLWVSPWAKLHYSEALASIQHDFPNDIENAPVDRPRLPWMQGDWHAVGSYTDEWGCRFVNICPGIIGEVKEPIVASYKSDLDKVRIPEAWINVTEGIDQACDTLDRFMLGIPGVNPFERMQWIRGTEHLMMDLIDQPDGFFKLRDRIHEWNLAVIDSFCSTGVDAIGWSDDWGTQHALLIQPALWRELFKPMYRDYVERIHAAGKFAFMHSDGHIFDIYPDLIDIGVDAVNSQLFCMDIEAIAERFKDKITFWGEIDRQHILAHEPINAVQDAVRRVSDAFYQGQGGVIAQCEFGPGAKPENVRAVFETWQQIA